MAAQRIYLRPPVIVSIRCDALSQEITPHQLKAGDDIDMQFEVVFNINAETMQLAPEFVLTGLTRKDIAAQPLRTKRNIDTISHEVGEMVLEPAAKK